MRPRRTQWYAAILAVITVALWLPRLRGPLDMRYDSGVYYVLGTSLAEGRGYRLLNEPGAIEAVQYPPLLPALAAAHQVLLGTSDVAVAGHALRGTMLLLTVAYVLAVFALGLRLLPAGYAFLAALFTAMQPQTVFMSDMFSAEIPYGLVTVVFFVVLLGGTDRWRNPAAGLLAVAAYAFRTAGLALLAAWVAESLLRRRGREALVRAAVALAAVSVWTGYTASVKSSAEYRSPAYPYQRADYQYYNVAYAENMSYIDPFRPELGRASKAEVAFRLLSNGKTLPWSIGEAVSIHHGWWVAEVRKLNMFVPPLNAPEWLADIAVVSLSVVTVAGIVLLTMAGHSLIGLYLAGSIFLMCVTPWPGQFTRYMTPLIPFLLVGLMYALGAAAERAAGAPRRRPRIRALGVGVLGLILAQQCYTVFKLFTKHHQVAVYRDSAGHRSEQRLFFYLDSWTEHEKAVEWLAGHARPGERVGTSTPHWVYLMTGLPSVMPPFEADPADAQRLMDAVPLRYLVVDSLEFVDVGRRYTMPVIAAAPDGWEMVYRGAEGAPRIYRRSLESSPPGKNTSPTLGAK